MVNTDKGNDDDDGNDGDDDDSDAAADIDDAADASRRGLSGTERSSPCIV